MFERVIKKVRAPENRIFEIMTSPAIARAPNMKNSKNVRFIFENKTMKPVTIDGKKLLSMTL